MESDEISYVTDLSFLSMETENLSSPARRWPFFVPAAKENLEELYPRGRIGTKLSKGTLVLLVST